MPRTQTGGAFVAAYAALATSGGVFVAEVDGGDTRYALVAYPTDRDRDRAALLVPGASPAALTLPSAQMLGELERLAVGERAP
jgi:hypothetical protein